MAKSNNQKGKILYVERLMQETGENHVATMQDILAYLQEKGIRAERKSIYDDMEVLRSLGMDIRFRRGRPGGYYLAGGTSVPGSSSGRTEGSLAEKESRAGEEGPGERPETDPERDDLLQKADDTSSQNEALHFDSRFSNDDFADSADGLPKTKSVSHWKAGDTGKESDGPLANRSVKLICMNRQALILAEHTALLNAEDE